MRSVFNGLNRARLDISTLAVHFNRHRLLVAQQLPRLLNLLLMLALSLQPAFAVTPVWTLLQSGLSLQPPPSVANSQPIDLTNLPPNARPIPFATMAALEMELATRGLPRFYDSEATRAEVEPVSFDRVNKDCQNGRTPSEAGKKLVADAIEQITPGILALGGTFYPDVAAYFGVGFVNDCVMKFDDYTQGLLANYGSPAMLVQIDPNVLGGGVATMIFYKATGEAQFLFYSLEMQHITNNVMRLDHPATQRQSVINDALRLALLCFEYKPEPTSRGGDRNRCPFCDLCRLCLNNVVGDANRKYNVLKAGIEAGTIYGAIEKCSAVNTYLYRAGCLVAVLIGRKIALNAAAEDYNQAVRAGLEQCKKDIAEKTKDLPGGVVRCEYRETPQ